MDYNCLENLKGMDFKKFPKTSGIYKITNVANDKIYVGQAVNLRDRCRCHEKDLRLQKHKNEHLQRAYNFYGKYIFNFEILQICTITSLVANEDYWCKFYNSHNKNFGYNMRGTGKDIHRWSRESKEKVSKKIINIITGEIYISITEACSASGLLQQTLGKMLNGKRTNRTPFKYYDETLRVNEFVNVRNKKVINVKTGEIFNSLKDLCTVYNSPYSTICHKLNGYNNNNTDYKYL